MATEESCCPPGSWPALTVDYTPRGAIVEFDGVKFYVVGEDNKPAIIQVYDIFGLTSGRIKGVSDQLADSGFLVIVPDIYEGTDLDAQGGFSTPAGIAWLKQQSGEKCRAYVEKGIALATSRGSTSVGLTGYCWGVWAAFHAAKNPIIKAIVGYHPSLQIGPKLFGETEESVADGVVAPVLFMPAGGDPANVKPGGAIVTLLQAKFGDKTSSVEFPDQVHGWTVRGDVTKPEVAAAVTKALDLTVTYFKANL